MTNKAFILLLAAAFLVAIVAFTLSYFTTESSLIESVLSISFGFFFIMGFILLLNNGTLITTFYWNIILIFFSFLFIGILMKIQHWSYSMAFLSIGFGGIVLVYSFYFIRKKEKKRLDVLKELWVVMTCISSLLTLLHLYHFPYFLKFLSFLVLTAAVVDFSIQEFKQEDTPED